LITLKQLIEPTLLILAGGLGTRLRSVVAEVPKTLAPVAGRPFLFWLLQNLERQGIRKVVLSLHHKADLVQQVVAKMPLSMQIRTVVEPTPLGTGGAIAFAVQQKALKNAFWVMNGDTWLGEWVEAIQKVSYPAVGLVEVEDTSRYGLVEWSNQNVYCFSEKKEDVEPGWINAGVYHLHADDFAKWDGRPFSLERKLLPNWVSQGRLNAFPLQTEFIDIGFPEDYRRFCSWMENDIVKPSLAGNSAKETQVI